jgi:hypothetical protein
MVNKNLDVEDTGPQESEQAGERKLQGLEWILEINCQ